MYVKAFQTERCLFFSKRIRPCSSILIGHISDNQMILLASARRFSSTSNLAIISNWNQGTRRQRGYLRFLSSFGTSNLIMCLLSGELAQRPFFQNISYKDRGATRVLLISESSHCESYECAVCPTSDFMQSPFLPFFENSAIKIGIYFWLGSREAARSQAIFLHLGVLSIDQIFISPAR
jgi:hypothetical protein